MRVVGRKGRDRPKQAGRGEYRDGRNWRFSGVRDEGLHFPAPCAVFPGTASLYTLALAPAWRNHLPWGGVFPVEFSVLADYNRGVVAWVCVSVWEAAV